MAVPAISFALSLNPKDFLFQKLTELPGLPGQVGLLMLQLLEFVAQFPIVRARGKKAFHERLAFPGQRVGPPDILFPQTAELPFAKIEGLLENIIRICHYIPMSEHVGQRRKIRRLGDAFFQILNNGLPFFNHRQELVFQKIGQKYPVLVFLHLDHLVHEG